MRRISAIAVVGTLSLTMVGCGSNTEEPSVSSPPPQQVVTQPDSASQPFEKPPVVPQTSVVKVSSASGLIQSTNGNQRAKQVEKGRKDPFAGLFAPVVVAKAPTPPTPKTVAPLPKPSVVPPPPPKPVAVVPRPAPLPSVAPAPPVPPAEPVVAAQPDVAKGITVTGVVQIGDELQAIVQVPNEGTSRYVREGQLLSSGEVLVKRIEVNQGAQPLVILEEKGIEVAKAIGETPADPNQTPAATNSSDNSDNDSNTPTNNTSSPSPSNGINAPPRNIPSSSPSNSINAPTTDGPSSLPLRNRNTAPANIPSPPPNNISPPTPIPSSSPLPSNDNDSEDER